MTILMNHRVAVHMVVVAGGDCAGRSATCRDDRAHGRAGRRHHGRRRADQRPDYRLRRRQADPRGRAPRTIALADVQRIEIGKSIVNNAASDLAWIGQDNHDLVQVGGASGGNGIQDMHLHVSNLKPQGSSRSSSVCRLPKQLRVWRLDTSQSPHWRLAIARADLAADAEMYLEPPADDSFGQKFDVTFTYNDGSTSTSSVTASTHTSDQLKLDNAAAAAPAAAGQAPGGRAGRTSFQNHRLSGPAAIPGALHGDVTSIGRRIAHAAHRLEGGRADSAVACGGNLVRQISRRARSSTSD